jgi:NitT/TauT family transport system permease protein
MRIAQPLIQILASFPAPMLYPIALGAFFWLGISFDWGSMLLMLLGVQWYVLFNVLAGALRIPQELDYALALMNTSRLDRWKTLYLPSVFPSLVTGWVTAAGGAWNASVVAEYIFYKHTILKTAGLGATLSVATANENFTHFAASLSLMVVIVILLNRFVWSKIYTIAQSRYRMEG